MRANGRRTTVNIKRSIELVPDATHGSCDIESNRGMGQSGRPTNLLISSIS
jgi:hypothetical protein